MNQLLQLQKPRQKKEKIQIINLENTSKKQVNKAIIFDAGTLISFSMNGLLDLLKKLKSIFRGKFLITYKIKKEVIDNPIKNKKFELEALKIKDLLDKKIIELPDSLGIDNQKIYAYAIEIMELANSSFKSEDRNIRLIDIGEASCLALSNILTEQEIKNVIAIDERTTRMLAESHENLEEFLERKLHVKIKMNHANIGFFKNFKIIRSTELAYVAYKKGFIDLKGDSLVLDALLYALKFKGAAISGDEIEEIKRINN